MHHSTPAPCPCCHAPAKLVEEPGFFSLGCSDPSCRAFGLYRLEPASELEPALAAWDRRGRPEATDDEIAAPAAELLAVC